MVGNLSPHQNVLLFPLQHASMQQSLLSVSQSPFPVVGYVLYEQCHSGKKTITSTSFSTAYKSKGKLILAIKYNSLYKILMVMIIN